MRDFQQILDSPLLTWQEGFDFFQGKGMINNALHRLVADLEKHGIDYNLIGAVALNQHGYQRFTVDIDLLLSPEGCKSFRTNWSDGVTAPLLKARRRSSARLRRMSLLRSK